jgi:hypothetical protein
LDTDRQNTGNRNQESGIRNQESGIRIQGWLRDQGTRALPAS